MLWKRNITLQQGTCIDDHCVAMPRCSAKPHDSQPSRQPPGDSGLSLRQLAHELNSLLDGSLRCLRLAERALDESELPRNPDLDTVLHRLRMAEDGMKDIAVVLNRAMSGPVSDAELLRSERTVGEELEHVLARISPMAEERSVQLHVDLADDAAALPAGPLGPVLLNALRNAIEACGTSRAAERRVKTSITVNRRGSELTILIPDTGPGLGDSASPGRSNKAGGHGIGLGVCRDILAELGGRFEIGNAPFGRGAVMQAHVPLASLVKR